MKVVLAAPDFHQQRGNTVTVQRIADGLEKKGVETDIVSVIEDNAVTTLPDSDLVHGFHAYKFYKFKEKLEENRQPFVITITGTDLNHDLFNEGRRKTVLKCLHEAGAITVFNEGAKTTLSKEVPGIEGKIHVIHQGTSSLKTSVSSIAKEEGTFLFVLPAGIRKIKNVPFAINALKKLREQYPYIRLLLVGPIIEEDEGTLVKELAEQNDDWVSYIGQLPHQEMGAVYEQADIVLNTSFSEGQPAAIMEGMEYSLPVIASDNAGNRTLVSHGTTGFLYRNESEFLDYAKILLNNSVMRTEFGWAAKSYILQHHSRAYETEKFLDIYKKVLDGAR